MRLNDGGIRYAAFVEQELKAERDRRANLDTRAQLFVTASGAIVAALAGVGAFVGSGRDDTFPDIAHFPLVATLAMFTVTLILAILATHNFAYDVASRTTLWHLPRSHWSDSEDTAIRNITATNVKTVLTLRRGNNRKVILLLAALVSQLVALMTLGLTVYLMMIGVHR